MSAQIREYTSSVTLMITGIHFDPSRITAAIGFAPNQSWRKGETKMLPSGRLHCYPNAGWKAFQDDASANLSLEEQIGIWLRKLTPLADNLTQIRADGCTIELNCYLSTRATATFLLNEDQLKQIAALEIRLSFDCFSEPDCQVQSGSPMYNR